VDVEILKRALRELVEREPTFFRDLFLDALRADGRAAEALLDLFTRHPEAKLRLAQAVAGAVAIPLNVATKEDLKQLATKQDLEELDLFTRHPEAKLRLAQAVAGAVAIPLNVATKEGPQAVGDKARP